LKAERDVFELQGKFLEERAARPDVSAEERKLAEMRVVAPMATSAVDKNRLAGQEAIADSAAARSIAKADADLATDEAGSGEAKVRSKMATSALPMAAEEAVTTQRDRMERAKAGADAAKVQQKVFSDPNTVEAQKAAAALEVLKAQQAITDVPEARMYEREMRDAALKRQRMLQANPEYDPAFSRPRYGDQPMPLRQSAGTNAPSSAIPNPQAFRPRPTPGGQTLTIDWSQLQPRR
jgi:hypothetical protein